MKVIVPLEAEILGMSVLENHISGLGKEVDIYIVDADIETTNYFTYEDKLVVFYREKTDQYSAFRLDYRREEVINPYFFGRIYTTMNGRKDAFEYKHNEFFGMYFPNEKEFEREYLEIVQEKAPDFFNRREMAAMRFSLLNVIVLPEEIAIFKNTGVAVVKNGLKWILTKQGVIEFDEILMKSSLDLSTKLYYEFWEPRQGQYIS